jgi:signal transduction histidine kinase
MTVEEAQYVCWTFIVMFAVAMMISHSDDPPARGGPGGTRVDASGWKQQRLRSALLMSVSLDLRTPLAAIHGVCQRAQPRSRSSLAARQRANF